MTWRRLALSAIGLAAIAIVVGRAIQTEPRPVTRPRTVQPLELPKSAPAAATAQPDDVRSTTAQPGEARSSAPQSKARVTTPGVVTSATLGDCWLNTRSNVRHGPTCRWFRATVEGRLCGPEEGTPCKKCGG